MRPLPSRLVLLLLVLLAACEVDLAPVGLRATPAGNGPHVRFQMPVDIPLPNDVATSPDPTSRTGRRPAPSMLGTTALEQELRSDFAAMEGWGVSSAITVGFDRSATVDVRTPAIDLDAVLTRMANDEHDPANDPFYVVNLSTGIPALLDIGANYSPLTLRDPARYGPNDPKASESNLIFETEEEGAGLPELLYTAKQDRDFDGILDHPNLYDWYERETDTLLLRPIVPLQEMTEYAVVLTDRLRGPDGQVVVSPFPFIHHPSQRDGVARLRDWLSDKRLASYYGDIAGSGLDHVAFAWTFTTAPTQSDLQILRDGLYGHGVLAGLANQYPTTVKPAVLADACANLPNPNILKLQDPVQRSLVQQILQQTSPFDAGSTAALDATLDAIDHIAMGTFHTPYLLGDPKDPNPDSHFQVDFQSGAATIASDDVPWLLVVPKATTAHKAPFPVAILAPRDRGHADEALFYAAEYARQGVAMLAYDLPGHGLTLPNAQALFASSCFANWYTALTTVRGTGANDAWWTAHPAHDRDILRQGVLDGMNLVRIVRAFDGRKNGDKSVLGDFDGDGTPDVGGPNAPIFATGSMTSAILGAVEPLITATAPIATGGGLGNDVAFRSATSDPAADARVLGPWIFAVPADERTDTQCGPDDRSVRISGEGAEVELACLHADELAAEQTVIVTNIVNHALRCARTGADGRFVIPVPTTSGDRLDIQVYTAPDVVNSYGICEPQDNAPVGRRIKTFELASTFRGQAHAVDDDLVSPMDGLGLRRQSSALRRYRDVVQALLDPGDPLAFANRFMLAGAPLLATASIGDAEMPIAAQLAFARAAGALPFLPPSAADTLTAHADFASPRDVYAHFDNQTPMRYLVANSVVEGVARLGRTSAGPACAANVPTGNGVPAACSGLPTAEPPYLCQTALFDPDWPSEGAMKLDEPHPDVPLRLARIATVHTTGATALAAGWSPRLTGVPFAPDSAGWTANAPVVGLFSAYVEPNGAHAWTTASSCKAWDPATYGNALLARFFATNGRDIYYLSHPNSHACLASGTCDFSH